MFLVSNAAIKVLAPLRITPERHQPRTLPGAAHILPGAARILPGAARFSGRRSGRRSGRPGHASLQYIIHQLRHRPVQSLHHPLELHALAQIPERVIVIVHQRRHPRLKGELISVILETIPKDRLGLLTRKRREPISATCGDEIHLIVNVPMLKAMLTAEVFPRAARRFSDALVHVRIVPQERDPVNRVAPAPPACRRRPLQRAAFPPHEKGLPKVYLWEPKASA